MDFSIFALAAPVTTEGGAEAATPAGGGSFLLIMLVVIVGMYLFMFLGDRKRKKQHKEKMDALKKGDRIYTTSGIIGTIDFLGDKTAYIKTCDAKIEIAKQMIGGIYNPAETDENK